ncbi:DUF4132 domain-containing protein [Streptomyces lanatus]|uniref:DUF4132 domain-containing protein n=1 Tax=Streptomyces lanatus TaxID=66900 RepID=A0ABV1XJZ0_9ACTN|nr:DUF4132 domain-containing protein [Streptomyces lanatus]GHG95803.1 hypothetical protein GCM10018780_19660 [Streptomyces lanatus]
MRRWEFVGDGSAKFWEAEAEGTAVTVRYGRVGAEGRTQVKELASAEAAEAHLAKVIAEKERKGYREVAGEAEVEVEVVGGASAESVVSDADAVELPDEDAFEVPAAWRRLAYPRRGGIRRSVSGPRADAEELVAGRLKEEADWVEQMLSAPKSDPQIVEATRAHLNGSPSPLGAAALATVTMHYQLPEGVFVDAWVKTHGLAFAARAVMEYFDIEGYWLQYGGQRQEPRLCFRHPVGLVDARWARPQFADRMRALLTVADEESYREAVTVLDRCRDTERHRIVVSYLMPGERDWVDECCTGEVTDDPVLQAMLLCSLHSPDQLAHFGDKLHLNWGSWSMALIATLAEGTGAAFAPLLERALEEAYGSDRTKSIAGALVELPTDDAFGILLARVEDKHVRPSLLEAIRRYPVRALRLLGKAALGSAKYASMAQQLLATHVQAHQELTATALPGLPADIAALVEAQLTRPDRVTEAPVTALPALLVSPPWTRKRTARKARVAAVTPVAPEPRVAWLPGEREQWAGVQSWYAKWRDEYTWGKEIELLQQGGQLRDVRDALLFVDGPEDVVRPLLATCAPEDYWDGEATLKPVAAKHEVHALPLLLHAAARHPATLGTLLLPYPDVEVAGLVCDWLARLKSADATARAWVSRHGVAAVPVLVPHAVGRTGVVRRGAEKALRLVADAHGGEAVLAAVAGAGQEAVDIVGELLSADPLESALPARMPVVGAWAEAVLLPQILLKEGDALPLEAARHAITLLALSKPGEVYPGLDVLTEHCTADSLAAFAWGLFEQWRLAGMPPKESWALHALGWLGDDDTVRRLTPVLRAWPGEGAHHRAVEGLNVLATIGSDVALLHLHGIAQRVPFKALKVRAQEKIAEVAEGLGLTAEQLGDRLVPDFGLDADGSTVIDYGTRKFTVGFDEQLRPYVRDADGKPRKALPAPAAKDDPELAPAERKRFAALKKDVRTVATDQVRRLEAAMVNGRSWTAAEFQELFVAHPLLWHLVRRLVWLSEADGAVTAFRVAEDRTFADVEDDELALPEDATVRLAHPLRLDGDLGAWSELFADYEILQPFPQLGRAVHALTEEEAASHRLARFEDETVPVGKLLGLTKRGWERGTPQDAGVERWFSRRIDGGKYLVIELDPGIAVGMVDELGDQTFRAVWLDDSPGDHYPRRNYPLRFAGIDPVIASEILADLTEVTAK